MPSGLVVAVPASRPDAPVSFESGGSCDSCGNRLEGELAPHVCASCGSPAAVSSAGADRFAVMGTARTFTQDLAALEKRFYLWSRALHPDRFATRAPELRERSLARMSLLNDAWQTLKNADLRREHLLALEGVAKPKAAPLELAAEWFEIQDLMMDDPERGARSLVEFESAIESRIRTVAAEIAANERLWDAAAGRPSPEARAALDEIASMMNESSTLASLRRDVARAKARIGTGS